MEGSSFSLIDFPLIKDPRGNLSFIQNYDQIPFKIERIFWLFDVPSGEVRGGHAYKNQEEVIISLSGSFDVIILDKNNKKIKVTLNRSSNGIYLPPNTWRHIENFSTNSISLHISSMIYSEKEYIRNLNQYLNAH